MTELQQCTRSRARFRRECHRLREENKQLRQDVEDMHDSRCTRFERCKNCEHLHDTNIICPDCGWDNSLPREEQQHMRKERP